MFRFILYSFPSYWNCVGLFVDEKPNISNFDVPMMNSVTGSSGSTDLDDTFTEIFRGPDSNSGNKLTLTLRCGQRSSTFIILHYFSWPKYQLQKWQTETHSIGR